MTIEEAIRILDPETTVEALAEIEYYAGFRGKEAEIKAVEDSFILAVSALREQLAAVDSGDGEVAETDSVQCRNGILRSGECADNWAKGVNGNL